jgi:hypothetical protein
MPVSILSSYYLVVLLKRKKNVKNLIRTNIEINVLKPRKKERKNMQTTRPSSKYFLKNSPYIRGAVDSPHHWYGESWTPRIGDTGSRRLRVSLIRGVNIWERKISLAPFFRTLNSLTTAFKWPIWQKISQGSNLLSQLINRNGSNSSVRDPWRTVLCKNIGKTGSLPCPFKRTVLSLVFPPRQLRKIYLSSSRHNIIIKYYL